MMIGMLSYQVKFTKVDTFTYLGTVINSNEKKCIYSLIHYLSFNLPLNRCFYVTQATRALETRSFGKGN